MVVSPLVSSTDLIRFLPEIILTVMGTAMMVLDPVLHKRSSYAFGHLAERFSPLPRPGRPLAAC